jgi:NAD(P)-dependent dehydrogenase (short-subunit alcohol dehydrogenase family)
MQPLQGQRYLVTGAAVRIGRAIALAFARAGARVVVHYRHAEAEAAQLLAELSQFGDGHESIQGDLCLPAERERLIPELLTGGRRLDGLINNASVYRRERLIDTTDESLAANFDINFIAPFLLMRDFARHCHQGSIINLLDQRVGRVEPGAGTYGLAKKCLRDATEAAALEWAPQIRVNAVAPGLVLPPPGADPDKLQGLLPNIPLGQVSSPEDIAEACLFLAASKSITGHILYVDGGMHLAATVRPEVAKADYSGPR